MKEQSKSFSWIERFAVIILSLGMAILLYVVIRSITYATYTTTDDVYLMHVIAGYYNNRPMEWVPFLSPCIVRLVFFLYNVFPNVNCYTMLQVVLMILSIAAINYSVFCQARQYIYRYRFVIWAVISILIDSLVCWMLVRMHFYYVSVLTGTAAFCIILSADFRHIVETVIHWLAIAFFFFICASYSVDVSYSLCCFVLLAIAYRAVQLVLSHCENKKSRLIHCGLTFGTLIIAGTVMIFGTLHLIRAERDRMCGEEYTEWNTYRISYWDYGSPKYEDAAELYNNVGWTKDFYRLTKKMYFMDERFGSEQLSQIVRKFDRLGFSGNDRTIKDAVKTAANLIEKNKEARGLSIVACCLFLCCLLCGSFKKRNWIRLAASICAMAGSFLLCFYLSYRNRLPLRAYVSIMIPCALFLELTLIASFGSKVSFGTKERLSVKQIILVAVAGIILLAGAGAHGYYNYRFTLNKGDEEYYEKAHKKEKTLYKYAAKNHDRIIVYDWSCLPTYEPFPQLQTGDLSNLFCWGGARLHTYAYNEQLKQNGLEVLNSDAFGRDDVVFVSASKDNIDLLYRFLMNEYGIGSYEIIDELPYGFMVVKFY